MWCVKHINFNSTIKIFPQATLQDVTILVAVVPKILKLVTWFVKKRLPKPKDLVDKQKL